MDLKPAAEPKKINLFDRISPLKPSSSTPTE
jgi:hypothetical protein